MDDESDGSDDADNAYYTLGLLENAVEASSSPEIL